MVRSIRHLLRLCLSSILCKLRLDHAEVVLWVVGTQHVALGSAMAGGHPAHACRFHRSIQASTYARLLLHVFNKQNDYVIFNCS